MSFTTASQAAFHNGTAAAHPKQGAQGQASGPAPRSEPKALPPSMLTPSLPARPSPLPSVGAGAAHDLPSMLKSPPESLRHDLSPVFEESGGEPAGGGAHLNGIQRSLADDLLASSFHRNFSPNPHERSSRNRPDAESKSTTFHTPGPKARASQHTDTGSNLLEAFPAGAAIDKQNMLNDAIRVVEGNVVRPPPGPSGSATTVYAGVDEFRKDFKCLHERLSAAIPPAGQTPDRTWSTMAVLLEEHVTAEELPGLVAEGRLRDVVRSVVHSQIVFWAGFGLSGTVGLVMGRYPPLDPLSFAEPRAQALASAVNFALGYSVQSLIVGLAEAGIAVSAEGRLDMQYNKQQPVRDGIQSTAFWSFAVGHGLVDSGLVTQDMLPETVAKARIASGAVCTLAVGLHRALLPYWLTQMDPVWLDASTPEKAAAMRKYIDNLRQPRSAAIGGYLKDLGKGLKGGIGIPSMAAFTRGLYRAQAVALVLSGRAVAFKVESPQAKLITNLVTDAFLGAAWGVGTTVAAKAVEGVKRSLEDEKARRQPVRRDLVADIVPASVLARRKASAKPAGVYRE